MKWNNRTLVIVLGVLAIILIALLIKDRSVNRADEIFLSIDSAKVTEISIKSTMGNALIRKEGNEWRLKEPKDAPMQKYPIQSLLQSLDTMEVEYVVTDERAKWKDYQVDDSSGAHVTVKTGKETYQFIVGSLGPTWRHTHMRKQDNDKVYLVKGAIRSNIVKNPNDWRDRTVFMFNPDSLGKMEVLFPDKKDCYELAKVDSEWVTTPTSGKKFKPDGNAVLGIVNGVLKLSIGEFLSDSAAQKIDWTKPLVRFAFEMKDGSKHNVAFFENAANAQQFAFKADANSEPYATWKGSYDMMAKKAEDLKPEVVAKRQKREAEGMKKAKSAIGKHDAKEPKAPKPNKATSK